MCIIFTPSYTLYILHIDCTFSANLLSITTTSLVDESSQSMTTLSQFSQGSAGSQLTPYDKFMYKTILLHLSEIIKLKNVCTYFLFRFVCLILNNIYNFLWWSWILPFRPILVSRLLRFRNSYMLMKASFTKLAMNAQGYRRVISHLMYVLLATILKQSFLREPRDSVT